MNRARTMATWALPVLAVFGFAVGETAAQLIDFETVPGVIPGVGVPVSDEYLASAGVSFSIDGGGDTLFLGDYGSDREGWRCNDGQLDCLFDASFDGGDFFLAHPDAGTPALRDVLIDYATPTDSLGFDLADIDALEEWTITAYDAGGAVLTTVVLDADDPGTGDGLVTNVVLDGVGPISQVRIHFSGSPNPFVGFGFDNFTPSCPGRRGLIDFESVPDGTPALGLPISTEYDPGFGVSFSVDGGSDLMSLGDYSNAREGWRCNGADPFDCVDDPSEFGTWFLAHPDAGGVSLRDFIVEYADTTPELEFDLADVDGFEQWTMSVFDIDGSLLQTQVLTAGDAGTGDGKMTHVVFSGVGDIATLRISFTGTPNPFVGFGFDNFNTSCGNPDCDLDLVLTETPETVARGELLRFTVNVRNPCDDDLSFDAAVLDVSGPASLTQSLYSGPLLPVGAGGTLNAPISLPVPGGAPLGSYTFTVTVSRGGTTVTSDSFTATVQ